jgi:general secretion pathway protein G
MTSMRRGVADRGFTFVELVVVTTILLVLASTAIPMARVVTRRRKEAELRQALREMRTAIDRFKDAVDQGLIATSEVEAGHEGYPPDLDVLVEGVSVVGDATERELRFLRRVPVDPMTGEAEWGLRSYLDEPDARSWGGDSVFDVRSLSEGTALDGSPYRDW